MLFTNGFVFYGGLIGAVLAMWWYTHHFKMDFWQSVELLIPSVPLVHAFGRDRMLLRRMLLRDPRSPIGIALH